MATYEITSLPALPVFRYSDTVAEQGQVPEVVGSLFARLVPALTGLGLTAEHPTLAWYTMNGNELQVSVGVEADGTSAAAAAEAGLQPGDLDAAATAVVTRYTGTLDGIGSAWQDLHAHLNGQGLTPNGPNREVYLAGSVDEPDSWVVDLQQPVA